MKKLVRIEQGSNVPDSGGGITWTVSSSAICQADIVLVSAEGKERYQSIDAQIDYRFTFRGRKTITMKGTRFVIVAKGHPRLLGIFTPAAPSENVDQVGRETSVLVTDTGTVASA